MRQEVHRLFAEVEERHWWFTARRRILVDVVQELLPPGRGGTIVDVGCGTGANIAAFADDYRCIGVDTAPTAIELAERDHPGVEFALGEAPAALGTVTSSADLFLITDVLEHIEDDRGALSRLTQAARPGARFVITVPADMALWSRHDEDVSHYRRYDMDTLRAVWRGLPLREVGATYFNARLYPIVRLVRHINRGRSAGATAAEFSMPAPPLNRMLERIFLGERRVVLRALHGGPGYRRGVSILAVVERIEPESGSEER